MGPRRDEEPSETVTDVTDDGRTDAEVAAEFMTWLDELDAVPAVSLPVSAADELRRMYAEA